MDPDAFDRIMQESIAEEIAARDFYRAAARRVENESVREVFEQLAREEDEHRATLETFRYNPLARVTFERVQDFGVSEGQEAIRAPSVDMAPKDALQLAMKKEQAAMMVYQRLAEGCSDAEIRKLYLELAEMERGHKARLETLFVDVAYPEVW